MIYKIYTVYDSKAEYYLQPIFMNTKGEALRVFADWANDKSTTIGKHPEDYILYEIAEYDNKSGEVKSLVHTALGKAIEFVKE